MNGPTTPIAEVAGTWVVAVLLAKHGDGTFACNIILAQRSDCTEAEAVKEALESALEMMPGFLINQWLTTFVPVPTRNDPLQISAPVTPISNERGDE